MAIVESSELIEQLKAIVGPGGYREGEDIDSKNYKDLMGARSVHPPLLMRPETTEQVSQILKACHSCLLYTSPSPRDS